MCQAYHKTPSEIHGIEGAAGFFFDQGIFLFGRWVEAECQEAEQGARNEMFAKSARARTFARCMGDDMGSSTAGYADPWADGIVEVVDAKTGERKRRSASKKEGGDEVMGLDALVF
jgi:hypothetical protein